MPAFARASLVLEAVVPCNGPEYVSLRGTIKPFGFEVPVSVAKLRDTPLTLYRDPIPEVPSRA